MRRNIVIEFEPKCTYKEWIFSTYTSTMLLDFFSKKQVEEKLEEVLSKIPKKIIDTLEELGWKIIVTNKRNLEKECGASINIYGYTNFDKREILVYANKYAITESIPHEIGHFIDSLINISDTKEWENIYNLEIENYKLLSRTFTTISSKEECFADSFLLYFINQEKLKKECQETYRIINNLIKYIDYILDEELVKNRKIIQDKEDKYKEQLLLKMAEKYSYN